MKVNLVYFKQSGKYYSEGSYETNRKELYEIWYDVSLLMQDKELPGLTQGHSNFIVSVDVPEHPNNHPHLILKG